MVFRLFSTQLLVLLAYALSVNGLALLADMNSLGKRNDGFVKLYFVVNRDSGATDDVFSKRYLDIPLTQLNTQYVLTLNFGTDFQPIDFVIDTGSSDLWVPSVKLTPGGYDSSKSSDFKDLRETSAMLYSSGESVGEWVTDLVTIPNEPSLQNFQFADITFSETFMPGTGILGANYVSGELLSDLLSDVGRTRPWPNYPNFPVALKNAGLINKVAYSLYLEEDSSTGSIIFGGYDTEKYLGSLASLPIESSKNLEVTLDSVTASNDTLLKFDDTVVLDSGSTYSYLSSEIVQDIVNAAGLQWVGDPFELGIISFNSSCTTLNRSLGFNFAGKTIQVPLQSLVVNQNGTCYLGGLQGNVESQGSNILGESFLKYAYVVYNLEDKVIEIAQSKYNSASNIIPIT